MQKWRTNVNKETCKTVTLNSVLKSKF